MCCPRGQRPLSTDRRTARPTTTPTRRQGPPAHPIRRPPRTNDPEATTRPPPREPPSPSHPSPKNKNQDVEHDCNPSGLVAVVAAWARVGEAVSGAAVVPACARVGGGRVRCPRRRPSAGVPEAELVPVREPSRSWRSVRSGGGVLPARLGAVMIRGGAQRWCWACGGSCGSDPFGDWLGQTRRSRRHRCGTGDGDGVGRS